MDDKRAVQIVSGLMADLGILPENPAEVFIAPMKPTDLIEGQPHYVVGYSAYGVTARGKTNIVMLVGDDDGGLLNVNVKDIDGGPDSFNVDIPFLDGEVDTTYVLRVVERGMNRKSWLYHKMRAKEISLGLR